MSGFLGVLVSVALAKLYISGAGYITNTSGTGTFSLGVVSSEGVPSAYAWSTTAGTLSSSTAASPTLTLTASATNAKTATVTCVATVGGVQHTLTATCTYTNP